MEFVPWYCRDEATLQRWGVSLTTSAHRMGKWKPDNVDYVPENLKPLSARRKRIDLVVALCGQGDMVTNVNVPNKGQIGWLPDGHVVETMGAVTRDRVTPHVTGDFPLALQSQIQQIAHVQELTLQASLECDRDKALEALMIDPLVSIPTDKAEAMLDELISANGEWLSDDW